MELNKLIKKLEESAVSSFKYEIPSDPEKLLYDFYFLTGYVWGRDILKAHEEEQWSLNQAVKDCSNNLKSHMEEALKFALGADIHNWLGEKSDTFSKQTLSFLSVFESNLNKTSMGLRIKRDYDDEPVDTDDFDPKEYSKRNSLVTTELEPRKLLDAEDLFQCATSYACAQKAQDKLGLTDTELSRVYEQYYNVVDDMHLWPKIAQAWRSLVNAKTLEEKIIYIDHAYDLQHWHGTIFMKLRMYYKSRIGLKWLERALDWKKENTDIRKFYDLVSSSLRPIVSWVSYNEYGKTIKGR